MYRSCCFALVTSLVATLIQGSAPARRPFDYGTQVGLITVAKQGHLCLSIHNRVLKSRTRLAVIWVPVVGASSPPEVMVAEVVEPTEKPCSEWNADVEDSFYFVTIVERVPKQNRVYFAVVFPPEEIVVSRGRVRSDLDQDGTSEEFRVCTSVEGLHLTVWSGEPLKGKRHWHRYYYLGYEVEPTCADPDYKE